MGRRVDRAATYWAVNVGAAMAAAWLHAGGRQPSIPRIIAAGFAGGSLVYAGQRAVGAQDARLRLAGLELVAVGASVTGNIARGHAPLAELTLPFFPVYLRVRTEPGLSVRVRLSAAALLSTVRLAATYEQAPDLGRWLTSGVPVFSVPRQQLQCREHDGVSCATEVVGQHLFGAVAHATQGDGCLYHELGHVTQDVRDAVLFAVPASDYVLDNAGPAGRWLARYLVVDATLPLMFLNTAVGDRFPTCAAGSFYECEVNRLTR